MEEIRLWGAIVNALAIVGGSLVGLLVRRLIGGGKREGKSALSDHIYYGMGLCVLIIGISGAIEDCNILIVILSVALGSVLGHLMRLESGINILGNKIEVMAKDRFGNVAEGFVSASLLFCVGSMAIVGALNSGLSADHTVQYTKATIDCVVSVVMAVSLGVGVCFSALPVFVLQGGITLFAQWIAPFLTADIITAMSVVGSILIVGVATNMLGMTRLKIMNYMPATFLPLLLVPLFGLLS
ncbi:MAG: DUF554 domain-containing protein [Clostridia bacterium]|nr:DUF554 domain-containing protein [Clostridia bacterium]